MAKWWNVTPEVRFQKDCVLCLAGSLLPSCLLTLFFFLILFIYLFIYLWLCWVFISVRGLSPVAASGGHSSSRCAGLPCCGAQAPDAQAQQMWLTGLVAPRHVGSSQTRARTCVPCIGRQTLNHCTTREAQLAHSWWKPAALFEAHHGETHISRNGGSPPANSSPQGIESYQQPHE